jgi:hypothetical protein
LVILDCALPIHVKETEGDIILGIWLRKKVFEGTPVLEVELPGVFPVSDTEENGILFAFNLVL